MKYLAPLLVIILLAASCSSPVKNTDPGQEINPAVNVTTLPGTEANLPPEGPVQELRAGSLTARIFSATDATVNMASYLIQGQANHKVVVTVNDVVFTASAESVFSLPIQLEEGPNLVEVIISDLEGNEVSLELTITYQP